MSGAYADSPARPTLNTGRYRVPLIVGRFEAGATIRTVAIGGGCVCYQQTYAPFSDVDWSTASLICSACKYNPSTRVWICPPSNPEPTIRIAVASSRQK